MRETRENTSLGQTRIASLRFGLVLASCGVPREAFSLASLPSRVFWRQRLIGSITGD